MDSLVTGGQDLYTALPTSYNFQIYINPFYSLKDIKCSRESDNHWELDNRGPSVL